MYVSRHTYFILTIRHGVVYASFMALASCQTPPPSPGDVIKQYIIDGLGMGVLQLARALNVPANRLYQILQDKRHISVDTARRLGYFLNMEPSFWMDVQIQYQLYHARQNHPSLEDEIIPFK